MIFAQKNYKIPDFYMIFARKMPEFYVIIARKISFPEFRGGGHVPLLPPVSYAYAKGGWYSQCTVLQYYL